MITAQDVFQQCHEHIKTVENRRDVAIGVLITLVLAMLAAEMDNGRPRRISLAFIAVAIGIFVLLGLLRRWKLIHLHTASVFMKCATEKALPSRKEASSAWGQIVKKGDSRLRWRSHDLWYLLLAAAVSAVIAVPLIAETLTRPKPMALWLAYLVAIASWFLIAVGAHSWATRDVDLFPEYAWMFRGLDSS
jgi:hypothetical protein